MSRHWAIIGLLTVRTYTVMTRRTLLLAGSALLASCARSVRVLVTTPTGVSDDASRQPVRLSKTATVQRTLRPLPTLRVAVPPLPPTLESQAQEWLHRLTAVLPSHWQIVRTSGDEAPLRLRTTFGGRPDTAIGGRWLLPVTTHDNLVDGLSADALAGLLNRTIDDWHDAGAPEHLPVELVSVLDFGYCCPASPQAVERASALSAAVATGRVGPGLFALVEPHVLAPNLRVLTVEAGDPLRPLSSDSLAPYLVEWLIVEGERELLPQDLARPTTPPLPTVLVLTFVGDIMLGRTVHRIMTARGDWSAPFRRIADELSWSDLTVGNLECALSSRFSPPDDPYTLRFLSFPAAIEGLLFAGIDAVSLANNHSMDFGADGLLDTRRALGDHGIVAFGAGVDREEALRPAFVQMAHCTVALLGFDGVASAWYGATDHRPGTAPLTPETIRNAISSAASQADIVIPFFHWGVEYTLVPTEEQRAIARLAIDSGATLVVGSHPHWVQGVEWYRGKPIFYSLGNFIFDQEWSWETKQSVILHLWFNGSRLLRYELVPAVIEDYHRPRLATGWEATDIRRQIRASSQALRSTGAALTPVP